MDDLNKYLKSLEPIDVSFSRKAKARHDRLTKPNGSLGRLEEIAIELAAMKRQEVPIIKRKAIFTLAGDHGVVEEGVSAYPQEVTAQMVTNFINGGAAVSVLARQAGADILIADLGVASDLNLDDQNFRNCKIAKGTANFNKGPAMTREQAIQAINAGIELFEQENNKESIDIVGTGEMGIGNTTPAAAILAAISGERVEDITGRGTGVDDEGMNRKIAVIKKALEINCPQKQDGLDILQKVGGFEIGGLAGVILAAAKHRVPVLIDGFISTAAALIAWLLNPLVNQYILASHLSEELGHKKMLDLLKKKPILNLGMRLGEGTGAALAMNIIDAAAHILQEMATFESAKVSNKQI